jgi:hypothetical protein
MMDELESSTTSIIPKSAKLPNPGMESSDNSSFVKVTNEEKEYRVEVLSQIIEEAKMRNEIINENYLLYKMHLKGIQNYNRSKLYQDRLSLDSQNNYIRNFLPRYSKYQEDINNELDKIREECIALSREEIIITKTHIRETAEGTFTTEITERGSPKLKAELLKIRAKVAELKQKHSEGQNINISAVIVQRELAEKRMQIEKLQEENSTLQSGDREVQRD